MKTYLGIDLGGTNVRVAKVTRDGIVLAEVKTAVAGAGRTAQSYGQHDGNDPGDSGVY